MRVLFSVSLCWGPVLSPALWETLWLTSTSGKETEIRRSTCGFTFWPSVPTTLRSSITPASSSWLRWAQARAWKSESLWRTFVFQNEIETRFMWKSTFSFSQDETTWNEYRLKQHEGGWLNGEIITLQLKLTQSVCYCSPFDCSNPGSGVIWLLNFILVKHFVLHFLYERCCTNKALKYYYTILLLQLVRCLFFSWQDKSSAIVPLFRGFILSLCEDQQSQKKPVDVLRYVVCELCVALW